MVNGSWLMAQAQGSRPMAHGSRLKNRGLKLMAKKEIWRDEPGSGGLRANLFLAMSHEPWAMNN